MKVKYNEGEEQGKDDNYAGIPQVLDCYIANVQMCTCLSRKAPVVVLIDE